MDVLWTILRDMWQGLLNFETGFIFAFLGAGALLAAIVSGIWNLVFGTLILVIKKKPEVLQRFRFLLFCQEFLTKQYATDTFCKCV